MKIHKEGYRLIFIAFFFTILITTLWYLNDPQNKVMLALSILSIIISAFIVSFFRNPMRLIPIGDNDIICPADGRVVVIEDVMETEYYNEMRKQVSIFMSPANVHVNRSPIDGEVRYFKYHPGKYLVAWHPKSSTDNERTSMVIENESFSVLVRQIAGKLARRIVYYIDEGDEIDKGEEFGFIKFGSRIDLFLPMNTEIKVELNQKVRGGESLIGLIPE